MKTVIPATTEVICDICGDKNNFRCEASLKIKRHALDYWTSVPVADASSSYDLCDICLRDVEEMLMKLKKDVLEKKTA